MGTQVVLDDTDLEIVEALQEDASQTLAEIGSRVTLSAAAVKRRIDRLRDAGVILGYTIQIDYAKLGRPLEAFVELRFAGRTPVDDITAAAAGLSEVEAVFTTAGDPDALVKVRADSVEHLKQVIDKLRRSGPVTGTKTLMVLGRWTKDSLA